jgi:hypothetical protein
VKYTLERPNDYSLGIEIITVPTDSPSEPIPEGIVLFVRTLTMTPLEIWGTCETKNPEDK